MTLARALKQSLKKKNNSQQSPQNLSCEKNRARPEHLMLGELGENLAADYLQRNGYKILQRNVRCRRDEIDIMARDGDEIVFVEVRTRTLGRLSPPESTVGRSKLAKLTRSAYAWVDRVRYTGFWRIDLIAITIIGAGENRIEHIKTITEAIN